MPYGAPQQGVMGPVDNGIDMDLVAQIAQTFSQMMGGGGSLPMRAFATGGVVNRPTIGLLGENGPEAVVPLGQYGQQSGYGQPQQAQSSAFQSPQQQGGWMTQVRPQAPQPGQQPAQAPYGYGAIPWLLKGGADAGAYGPNPPQAIMEAVRQRLIADSAAQGRSARLGLAGRSDVDPSTYGFQALMSDLQGQQNVSRGMNDADLQLRMKQMEFLQRLLFGEQQGGWGQVLGRENRAQEGFDWMGTLQGLGSLAGGYVGGGGGREAGNNQKGSRY
jgi:hypothetical protein